MSFFCPCPGVSPQRRFAFSSHAKGLGKIISHPAGHSVVTGFRATKKPAHKCVPTSRKRIDLSLLRWWLHIHVTGFEIQSRNCPLRFSDCRQLKAIQKRRYFPLAYRWRCPAESRHPKSVKNVIQLSLSNEIVLLYQTEQVFVKAFRVFCGCAEKTPRGFIPQGAR